MRSVIRKFDTLTEMIEAGKGVPSDWEAGTPEGHKTEDYYADFCGTASFAEATSHALMGTWDDPSLGSVDSVIEDARSKVRESGGAVAWDTMYETSGATWDLDGFLSGSPEHMVQFLPRPTSGKGQVIRVLVNLGAMGTVSADAMMRRGAALLALTEILSTIGKSVEVWGATSCTSSARSGSQATWTSAVCLKPASAPYDRGRMMFALANPSMHRRIVFGVRHNEPKSIRKGMGFENGGLGRTTSLPAALVDDIDPDVLLAEGLTGPGITDPVGWVIDKLQGLGLLGD